jgi:drug/metabolite transporter (DMT)-like permease
MLQVTIVGDIMAFLGAVAIIGYLQAGSAVRGWMPIFIYALPVTAVSALLLSLVALLVDRLSIFRSGASGIFGYFASLHGWWVLYLAVVPGLVGHTGFNTLLRFFSPLVISMAFPFEPLVGSGIGLALGLERVPGVLTWLGGSMIVCALVYNTYCESRRAATRQKKAAVSQVMAVALNDNESMEMAAFTIADGAEDVDFFVDQS